MEYQFLDLTFKSRSLTWTLHPACLFLQNTSTLFRSFKTLRSGNTWNQQEKYTSKNKFNNLYFQTSLQWHNKELEYWQRNNTLCETESDMSGVLLSNQLWK